jgi:hypothetical protein
MSADRPVFSSGQPAQLGEDDFYNMVLDSIQNRDNDASFCGSVAERYDKGRLEIHLHTAAIAYTHAPIAGDFCLAFKRAEVAAGLKQFHSSVWRNRRFCTSIDANRNQQFAVLVDVLKVLKQPERMRSRIIPSVIRLQVVDDCLRSWANMLDLAFPPASKPIFAFEDGERSLRHFRIRQARLIGKRQRIDKMIQGRSEIVETIPDDLGNNRWRRTAEFSADDIIASVRVQIVGDRIRTSFNPPIDLRPEKLQVVTCAL